MRLENRPILKDLMMEIVPLIEGVVFRMYVYMTMIYAHIEDRICTLLNCSRHLAEYPYAL